MANPQLENGHIRIANELFDAMCRAPLSGREFQVLNAILRRTYGWQKKSDSISLEQLKQATGITHRPWLMRLLKSLEDQKIIRGEHTSGYATIYAINKNYQDWTCLTGTTCPAQETRPHVGVGDMTRVQVGGDDPCTGRGPLPKDENIKRHEERHVLKTEESNISSPASHPIQTHRIGLLYRTTYLNGGKIGPMSVCRSAWQIIKKLEAHPYYTTKIGHDGGLAKAFEWVREERAKDGKLTLPYALGCLLGKLNDRLEAESDC